MAEVQEEKRATRRFALRLPVSVNQNEMPSSRKLPKPATSARAESVSM